MTYSITVALSLNLYSLHYSFTVTCLSIHDALLVYWDQAIQLEQIIPSAKNDRTRTADKLIAKGPRDAL